MKYYMNDVSGDILPLNEIRGDFASSECGGTLGEWMIDMTQIDFERFCSDVEHEFPGDGMDDFEVVDAMHSYNVDIADYVM